MKDFFLCFALRKALITVARLLISTLTATFDLLISTLFTIDWRFIEEDWVAEQPFWLETMAWNTRPLTVDTRRLVDIIFVDKEISQVFWYLYCNFRFLFILFTIFLQDIIFEEMKDNGDIIPTC